MFFRKKAPASIRTNGYYYFKQKRKTDQGEPIQIDYSFIFKEIQPTHDTYSHIVYMNFQVDKTQFDITLVRSAFHSIKQDRDCPEQFQENLCKTVKHLIEFSDGFIDESQRLGQK